MEDRNELKSIALHCALESRRNAQTIMTAEQVVAAAKVMYDFLIKEDGNKDT